MISWIICAILTVTNVFPDDPSEYGYLARTDIDLSVVSNAPWIYVPYPGMYFTRLQAWVLQSIPFIEFFYYYYSLVLFEHIF